MVSHYAPRLYLAAPFFNKEQTNVLDQLELFSSELNKTRIFSPRNECLCPPDASESTRKWAFEKNCNAIKTARFILARVDDYDPGTMWEIGFAFSLRCTILRYPQIYAFTTKKNRGLNLMLAQSCDGFIQTLPEVKAFLLDMDICGDRRRAKKWTKKII